MDFLLHTSLLACVCACVSRCAVLTEAVNHKSFSFSPAACEGYATLLRTYVSRNAAWTGRAILGYFGLSHERIEMCYANHPANIEEAVQSGLQEWSVVHCSRSATWKVLLDAMDHGGIACQHIASLRAELLSRTGGFTALYQLCSGCMYVVSEAVSGSLKYQQVAEMSRRVKRSSGSHF